MAHRSRGRVLPPAPRPDQPQLTLPPEILVAVISEATNKDAESGAAESRDADLLSLSLVSHAWHACSTQVRYSHFVVEWTLASFERYYYEYALFDEDSRLLEKVQSLTVTFRPLDSYDFDEWMEEDLERIAAREYASLPVDGSRRQDPDYPGWFRPTYAVRRLPLHLYGPLTAYLLPIVGTAGVESV